jgi:hypothetical protein
LVTNCLTKHVIEVKIEGRVRVTGRRGERRKQLLGEPYENEKMLKEGSTGSHCVENWVWKGLWTYL